MSSGPDPDAATINAAVLMLFHVVRPEQAPHMVSFPLGELQRLYVGGWMYAARLARAIAAGVRRGEPRRTSIDRGEVCV